MVPNTPNVAGLKAGFGLQGLLGGLVIGSAVFAPVIVEPNHVDLWAKLLLLAATLVYVVFAIVKDQTKIALTVLQSMSAAVLIIISTLLGEPIVVAVGLVAHAIWDASHLVSTQRYAPWWYAGACIYVDLAAAAFIVFR